MKSPNLLGSSTHALRPRAELDLYTTSQEAVQNFLDTLIQDKVFLPKNILEPCSGLNDISKVLIKNNYNVWSCDIEDRRDWPNFQGGDLEIKDFLKDDFGKVECIFTNPPYAEAEVFTRRALDVICEDGLVIMLHRLQFLESKSRYKLFKEFPPKYVYICSSRIDCYINGDKSQKNGMMAFIWCCWEKGCKDEPIIRWLK